MLFPLFHQQMHTQVTATLPFQLNKNNRIKPLHFSVFLLFYFQELLSKVFILHFSGMEVAKEVKSVKKEVQV